MKNLSALPTVEDVERTNDVTEGLPGRLSARARNRNALLVLISLLVVGAAFSSVQLMSAKHELTREKLARQGSDSSLSAAQTQVASLSSQVSSLSTQVAQLKSQLKQQAGAYQTAYSELETLLKNEEATLTQAQQQQAAIAYQQERIQLEYQIAKEFGFIK